MSKLNLTIKALRFLQGLFVLVENTRFEPVTTCLPEILFFKNALFYWGWCFLSNSKSSIFEHFTT